MLAAVLKWHNLYCSTKSYKQVTLNTQSLQFPDSKISKFDRATDLPSSFTLQKIGSCSGSAHPCGQNSISQNTVKKGEEVILLRSNWNEAKTGFYTYIFLKESIFYNCWFSNNRSLTGSSSLTSFEISILAWITEIRLPASSPFPHPWINMLQIARIWNKLRKGRSGQSYFNNKENFSAFALTSQVAERKKLLLFIINIQWSRNKNSGGGRNSTV